MAGTKSTDPKTASPQSRRAAIDQDDLINLSSNVFKVRRTLLEQFSRIERDMEKRARVSKEQFASKDELNSVIDRLHEFRGELDNVLLKIEERIQDSADSMRHTFIDKSEPASAGRDSSLDEIVSGLNPFNLRRKYHEFSLSVRSEEVDLFGFDPIFDRFVRPLFDFLYSKYWRVETYGISNIPRTGPCLMVGNHSGSLPYDATMLKMAVLKEHPAHREVRFMVEDFLFHFPFLGSLMNRFGGVRASQENAQQLLNAELPVVVFPEGVKGLGKLYRDKYHLARFGRGGFIKLCLRTGAPLVPVAFIGPEEIHPMLARETFFSGLLGVPYIPITPTFPWLGPAGLIPLPSKWSIHILPPIDFSQYGPEAEKDRVLVYRLAQQVKNQIQEVIVEQLKSRRSIWFG
ncbi:MAG: acyltransferase family protein [Proteobacteria bacterium]|nr:acyltransferase family protein [Pseudomonadota bacterium]